VPAVALLVAAGSGERLGADRPKAFVVLAGRPMWEWSVDALRAAGIGDVIVAAPPGYATRPGWVEGGATRSESVRNALAAAPAQADVVIVHDAARPLVDPGIFTECIAALVDADAAVAAAPVTDTVKEAGLGGDVIGTLDRSKLWAVQTPQVFHRRVLERALDVDPGVLAEATDDAWLVERSGGRVVVVQSTARNLKITTPEDFELAEILLGSQKK
jgi:2-C-methyl-D-erythritol 4-phosphate cytidylyltransferase